MREPILDILRQGRIVVADGAMGTILQGLSLPPGVMPEAWNAEHPEIIRSVHQSYLDVGSQLIGANTFGGNAIRMGEAGLGAQARSLVRRGAEIAREVAGDRAWVAGSVGPTGQLLEPLGPLTRERLAAVYAEQIEALAEGGVDLILVETQQDAEEALIGVRVAKERTGLPVFCSFAFNRRGRTMMGLKAAEAAQRAEDAGADAVGANCGEGPEAIRAALLAMREVTSLPLIAQSNAGIPALGEGARTEWDVAPDALAEVVQEFVALGARLVGGCCGTTAAHIAAVACTLNGTASSR